MKDTKKVIASKSELDQINDLLKERPCYFVRVRQTWTSLAGGLVHDDRLIMAEGSLSLDVFKQLNRHPYSSTFDCEALRFKDLMIACKELQTPDPSVFVAKVNRYGRILQIQRCADIMVKPFPYSEGAYGFVYLGDPSKGKVTDYLFRGK